MAAKPTSPPPKPLPQPIRPSPMQGETHGSRNGSGK
jgi:hypothetical protein